MTKITSLSNSLIKKYLKLKNPKYRKLWSLFLIEGDHLIEEALKVNAIVVILTSNPKKEGILVSNKIIKKLSSTKNPKDTIAVCKTINHQFCGDKILAIDNIQDPGNLGALIRAAKAFSYDFVIWSGADPYNEKVVRATKGAIFSIPFLKTNDISKYFADYQIIGAVIDKKAQKYDEILLKRKRILVLGNEANGISKKIEKLINVKTYIPINFESLNIAQAGAILMNQFK